MAGVVLLRGAHSTCDLPAKILPSTIKRADRLYELAADLTFEDVSGYTGLQSTLDVFRMIKVRDCQGASPRTTVTDLSGEIQSIDRWRENIQDDHMGMVGSHLGNRFYRMERDGYNVDV